MTWRRARPARRLDSLWRSVAARTTRRSGVGRSLSHRFSSHKAVARAVIERTFRRRCRVVGVGLRTSPSLNRTNVRIHTSTNECSLSRPRCEQMFDLSAWRSYRRNRARVARADEPDRRESDLTDTELTGKRREILDFIAGQLRSRG